MKKRLLSISLALCMLLSALPITARVIRAAYYEEVGDFYLIGAGSENYAWRQDKTNKVLYLISEGTVTVKNKDPNTATGWRIEIEKDKDVTLRLEGVNIDTKQNKGGSAITIGYNSTRNVRIEAVKDTVNRLTGWNGAGIRKNGDNANVGTLEIVGEGTLYATGAGEETYGEGGAGIGGFGSTAIKNICIDGPTVYATGGYHAAGIGAGGVNATGQYKYTDIFDIVSVSNIVIRSGTVIAQGGISGAGIGSGRSSAVDGITIEGGTVTATGGSCAAGIGGGQGGGAKNITIKGGDVTAYGTAGGVGIGTGTTANDLNVGVPKVDGITISGGVVRAFGSVMFSPNNGDCTGLGAGIGVSGWAMNTISNAGTADNITISGGTVEAFGASYGAVKTDDIGRGMSYNGRYYVGSCTNLKITGGSVNAPKHGCQAVNEKGQSVALMTISNPDEKAYYVNGVLCTPRNSKAIDGDTNLYLYLAEGDELKENTNAYHFHLVDGKITTDTFSCVPCSGNDGYYYHEEKCTVSGCGVSHGKVEHSFENFKCSDCGSDDERTNILFKRGGASGDSSVGRVSPDAKIYELITEPQQPGMSFKQWYYEKDGKKVVVGRNAKLRDIADAIVANGLDRTVELFAEYKTRELRIKGDGIVEGLDYSYSGDGVLTILSDKTMTISNVNPAEATTDRIVVKKGVNANIRLCDVYIDVSGFDNTAAFMIEDDSQGNVTLTITNSDNGAYENRLISGRNCAGIQKNGNVGSLTITEELTSSKVKISLTARGGSGGAGIGSGNNGNAFKITILKGHITAYGGDSAPGVGAAAGYVNNIVIGDATGADKNGPTVIAVGGADADGDLNAPGIGAGTAGDIYIYSGTVTAVGGEYANDIDICLDVGSSVLGKIHILGGSVKAERVSKPVVGASENSVAPLIIDNPSGKNVYVDGVKYIPSNHTAADAKDTNLYLWLATNSSHTVKVGDDGREYVYSYKNGRFDREHDLTVTSNTSEAAVEGTDYSYTLGVLTILSDKSMTIGMRSGVAKTADRIVTAAGVNANITLSGVNIDTTETGDYGSGVVGYAPISVADGSGENVTITLADGSVNTLQGSYGTAALQKGSGSGTLTITGKGTLNATGGDYGAGIGGKWYGDTNNIIILDGTIVAQGGTYGAGIGGGYRDFDPDSDSYSGGGASNITIKSGNVTATGGSWGAGIGSGHAFNESAQDKLIVSNITVEGGVVKAQGGAYCAGIGGGNWGSVSNITIKGGDVTAIGGNNGAGIGGGYNSRIRGITISGGKVNATGGDYGAGIGGGYNSHTIDGITISGGVVNANGDHAAGIGSSLTKPENITISGGTVTVTSKDGAGIGGGFYCSAEIEVVISGGSIRIAEPVNTDGKITALIGTGGELSGDPLRKLNVCIPKNGKGEGAKAVYLLVIANADGEDVYIDGVKYTPSNHTAGDATDTNLYAYLTDGRHTVKIGDGAEKVYHYDKKNSRFIETDCVDENKDHVCDYCGKSASQCADENKNHECDVCGAPMGVHKAAEGKHTCDYCGEAMNSHSGGEATCGEEAVCDICGEKYGERDNGNHRRLKHFEGKTATTEAEGNIEYWHCEDCNKYFSDKDCKNEITLADTVIAKLSDSKAPQTGDNSHMALWFALLFVSGGTLIGTAAYGKKRKRSAK